MKPKNKKIERIDYLDMVKGVGIILVVAGHSGYIPDSALTWLASFHMPLFFIVSGILFALKRSHMEKWIDFIKKRACGIMIPYISFSIIYLLIYLHYHTKYPETITNDFLYDSVLQTLSGYGMSVLWFLPSLFLSEICFYGILRSFYSRIDRQKDKRPVIVLFLILVGIMFAVLPIYGKSCAENALLSTGTTGGKYLYYLCLTFLRIFPSVNFLWLGYLIYFGLIRMRDKSAGQVMAGIGFLLLNIAVALKNGRVDMHFLIYNHLILYYIGAFSGAAALILILKNCKPMWLLSFLGENSLIVMLTHLDCQVLSYAIQFANYMNRFMVRARDLIFRFNLFAFILVVEVFLVILVNKYLFVLIGKTKPKAIKPPVFIEKIVRIFKGNNLKRVK